jgi:hypothetical protein
MSPSGPASPSLTGMLEGEMEEDSLRWRDPDSRPSRVVGPGGELRSCASLSSTRSVARARAWETRNFGPSAASSRPDRRRQDRELARAVAEYLFDDEASDAPPHDARGESSTTGGYGEAGLIGAPRATSVTRRAAHRAGAPAILTVIPLHDGRERGGASRRPVAFHSRWCSTTGVSPTARAAVSFQRHHRDRHGRQNIGSHHVGRRGRDSLPSRRTSATSSRRAVLGKGVRKTIRPRVHQPPRQI